MSTAQDKINEIREKLNNNVKKFVDVSTQDGATPKIDILNKNKETKKKETRGGPRVGSGRPPGGASLQKRLLKELLTQHFSEEIEVQVIDRKTGQKHVIKKPRVLVQAERMFNFGSQHYQAINPWLDRAVGKVPLPLVGDEDEPPIQVNLVATRALKKLYGNRDNK